VNTTLPAAEVNPGTMREPRRTTAWPRLVAVSTNLSFLGAVLTVSILAIAWSLLVRLPKTVIALQAHAISPGRPTPTLASVDSDDVLKQRVDYARRRLLTGREQLFPLLAELEQAATPLGWGIEASVKPGETPSAAPNGLSVVPVTMRLVNRQNPTEGSSAYHRLVSFLSWLRQLDRRLDVTRLNVKSNPAGVSEVSLELRVWAIAHENLAAE